MKRLAFALAVLVSLPSGAVLAAAPERNHPAQLHDGSVDGQTDLPHLADLHDRPVDRQDELPGATPRAAATPVAGGNAGDPGASSNARPPRREPGAIARSERNLRACYSPRVRSAATTPGPTRPYELLHEFRT